MRVKSYLMPTKVLLTLTLLAMFVFYGVSSFANDVKLERGKIAVTTLNGKEGEVKVHTYQANNFYLVNSHIVESKNGLVIIDVQFSPEDAKELRKYAESLNKKIVAVLITHPHPDHYLGAEVFKDVPIYATNGTITDMKIRYPNDIKQLKELGGNELPKLVLPTVIKDARLSFDGLTYEVVSYADSHNPGEDTVFFLKDYSAVFVGDILSYQRHPLIYDFDKFENAVLDLQKRKEYKNVFLGHQPVADLQKVTKDNLAYVKKAKEVLLKSKTAAEYVDQMHAAFKDRNGKILTQFQIPNLQARYGKHVQSFAK